MGINNLDKKYNLKEIVKGDSMFFATGITNSELVKGVKFENNIFYTETLVTHKNTLTNIVKKAIPNTWLIILFAIKELFLVPSSIG